MRAVAYYRLSKDREDQTSIERQRLACRAYADSRDWTIVEEFTDVDVSAYRAVARPGRDAAFDAIRTRRADVLLFWKLDRLVRRSRDFEDAWRLCEDAGAALACVVETIDTSTPSGRLMARILASFAENEGDNISTRTRDALRHQAGLGKPHKSGRRPFGLTADWSAVVPDEAVLVAEAVERTLAGDSLRAIVLDWRDRGIESSTGKAWTPQALRHLLTSPRLAGQRSHHGKVVADGTWPALVTPDVSARLRAVLNDSARRSGGRKHEPLLTGLLRCGKCGAKMRAATWQQKLRYSCPARPDGCFGVVVKREALDEWVVERALAALAQERSPASSRAPARRPA